jgi:hypothetical protein
MYELWVVSQELQRGNDAKIGVMSGKFNIHEVCTILSPLQNEISSNNIILSRIHQLEVGLWVLLSLSPCQLFITFSV